MTPELEIIFDTVKSSRKFQNLMSNSISSFVVGWTGEITVQYEGEPHQPDLLVISCGETSGSPVVVGNLGVSSEYPDDGQP